MFEISENKLKELFKKFFRYSIYLTKDEDASKDCAQEAIFIILEQLKKEKEIENIEAYGKKIIKNLIFREIKKFSGKTINIIVDGTAKKYELPFELIYGEKVIIQLINTEKIKDKQDLTEDIHYKLHKGLIEFFEAPKIGYKIKIRKIIASLDRIDNSELESLEDNKLSKEDDLIFLIDYEKCFNKLGDRCKTIIKERAKKSKYNEISEIINIPPKNVPGIISRCVKQLNLCLHVDR